MKTNTIRRYASDSWMVKRWDALVPNRDPFSFCEFWRTVLVWATLRSFLPKVHLPSAVNNLAQRFAEPPVQKAKPSRLKGVIAAIFRPIGSVLGFVAKGALTVILAPLRVIWWCISRVAEFIDDHPAIEDWLMGIIFFGVIGALIAVLGYLTYDMISDIDWAMAWSWLTDDWGFAKILGVVMLTLMFVAIWLVLLLHVFPWLCIQVIKPAFKTVAATASFIWYVAATNKKRFCPPMEIQR